MLFKNPWLLAGFIAVFVPVVIHLIRKQSAKPYDWGAMRFLSDTVATRRKRVEWEDFLLMVTRCLLLALIVLTFARPFVPPDTAVPWLFVLPLALLGLAIFGGSFVISAQRGRWVMRLAALGMVLAASFLLWQEKNLNLKRFQTSARRDVALVIDGSTSMLLRRDGSTAFERAILEAKKFVKEAPRGSAFSVILGAGAPELKTGSPLSNRADVLEILDLLEPSGGVFQGYDALGVATLSLAEGQGDQKDIVVFSDLQRLGWQLENTKAWDRLGEAWEGLASGVKSRLFVRPFLAPEKLRNVSVSDIEFSREVVGTDREVIIRVRVDNTGSEVVTPGEMRVTVGGTELERKGLGQMTAGESVVVDYRHRFSKAGPQVIKVTLEANDDLLADNFSERAVWVKKTLPVLLVEGNGGASFVERAGGYLSLALAPLGEEGEDFIDLRVIDAAALTREKLEDEAVVILADVARLPASVAARMTRFLLRGGGLWVIAGPKSAPDFYKQWRGSDGAVMPLELAEFVVPEDVVQVAMESSRHPALRLFRGEAGQDLSDAVVEGYRASGNLVNGAVAGARYRNGEIFLATRDYGSGRVMVTTTALDARLGNFPARASFVPFVHEVTNWLAGGKAVDLNLKATWNPSLILAGGGGLSGHYKSLGGTERGFSRVDSAIDFDWKNGAPGSEMEKDRFGVTWTGALLPPLSGEYVFEVTADDFFSLSVGGEKIYEGKNIKGKSERVYLKAGEALSFEARYEEEWGDAFVNLKWQRPDGVTEVIPSSSLLARSPEQADLILGEDLARDPLGQERAVEALLGKRGKSLAVAGTAIPGQYRVGIPRAIQAELKGEEELPLVVLREGAESQMKGWNEDDRALIRREIDLIELSSMEDVLAGLRGEGFGREIWKILALAAVVLLFLEGLLARWVSKSRQVGENMKIDFEEGDELCEAFGSAIEQGKRGSL